MPPLPSVIVPRSVVVSVGVVVVLVDSGVLVEVDVVLVLVVVLVVLVGVVVVLVVAVVVGVVVLVLEDVVLSSLPTTARATPRPMTAATSTAISALTPPLIPRRGGSPGPWSPSGGGTSIRLVGSSCTSPRV